MDPLAPLQGTSSTATSSTGPSRPDAGAPAGPPRIGLVGATGPVGASIAAALSAAGTAYAPIGRSAPGLAAAFGADPLAAPRAWNPEDAAGMAPAFAGLETLVYMVGVPYDAFHLHPILMGRTLAAAEAAGVRRMLLIGTAYPFGRPQAERVGPEHPRMPHTRKGQMRKAQEDLLLEADAAGRITGAILRLPDFYGPGVERSYLADIFAAAAQGRRARVMGPIDAPHEFVFVPDVGPVVRALLEREDTFGRTYNLAGAGTITVREVARQAFALVGREPKLMVAGKTMLRLAGLFDPLMRELVEMHYLMTTPVIFDGSALERAIGPIAKTSYADGIARCMAAALGKA